MKRDKKKKKKKEKRTVECVCAMELQMGVVVR